MKKIINLLDYIEEISDEENTFIETEDQVTEEMKIINKRNEDSGYLSSERNILNKRDNQIINETDEKTD